MNKLEFLNKELNDNYTSLDSVKWTYISIYQKLSENFIREFQDKIDWNYISEHQKLSENFIREFKNKVDWCNISRYQNLSEKFIREFQDKVDWENISQYQKLSEDFIREFQDKVDWEFISAYQKLSEKFIREFQDKVNWDCIPEYQKLSEDFIREFNDKIDWEYISIYQKLSPEFIKEFGLNIDEYNWLYKPTEFKKKQIIDCGLYECHKDYFIAYKAIRSDRYSHLNFQYQYLPNQTYECHCDCTSEENSFGLSVWTYEEAKRYCDSGLIVKVRVRYENVGRLVHDSNKIRCFKIEVLE